jgi:hypothetical protein
MSFRFRKSVKLLPGVRLNISKSGISTSIGTKGATVNIKKGRKAKVTVGVPGTGISYTSSLDNRTDSPGPQKAGIVGWLVGAFVLYALYWVVSAFG